MNKMTIFKDGNMIRLAPLTPLIEDKLRNELTYTRRKLLATYAERVENNNRRVKFTVVTCFNIREFRGQRQLITNAGYLPRLLKLLDSLSCSVDVRTVGESKTLTRLRPDWRGLQDFNPREDQRRLLEAVVEAERGQVCWATGAGKSYAVPMICRLMPKANIVVTTRHMAPLDDLYANLRKHLPSVGIYCSKKKKSGGRVMCISAGSLQHANPVETDVLIADEVHELATDNMFEQFARFRYTKMLGLSANFDDRFDGADFELEGIFGPLIASMSYQESVDKGLVVPIEVRWATVSGPSPCSGMDGVTKKRYGLWRHSHRNSIIAIEANRYPEQQVLITVKTLEHACYLKKHLPDYTLVYAPSAEAEEDIATYVKRGLLPRDEPLMTDFRAGELKRKFEKGTLRKVIATTVWNRGVNFHQLQVLIRADGSSSAIDDTQIPGRLSRLHEDSGKECGVLIDFLDRFDDGFYLKARSRYKNYANKGWTNILPDGCKL